MGWNGVSQHFDHLRAGQRCQGMLPSYAFPLLPSNHQYNSTYCYFCPWQTTLASILSLASSVPANSHRHNFHYFHLT